MRKLFISAAAIISSIAAVAQHSEIHATLDNSKIYPSTVHSYIITVPDSYTPDQPAALYLGLDGILCYAPEVIDSLMTKQIIPTTIGVFLQPGVVKDSDGSVLRYNRSNEFDATDDRFATFLETELLPAVEKAVTADGRPVKLTRDPENRMIFGLSSGGIAAFTAAWHRPDLFGKIFSGCGTFVPMRGGQNIQAIVRKHEPKPLRICLQDGYSDTWNPIFGSWFEANAMLGTALQFAGYAPMLDWAEGGHSVRRATEIFPDVMTWMWQPDTAAHTTSNNFLAPRLIPGNDWQKITTPVAVKPQSKLPLPDGSAADTYAFYPDKRHIAVTIPGSNFLGQYLVDNDGKPHSGQRFYWLHDYDNSELTIGSMTFDGDGYLWVATSAGIQICDQNGRVRGILSLPRDLNIATTTIAIPADNTVILTDGTHSYQRTFNNLPRPIDGQRPKSQGPA